MPFDPSRFKTFRFLPSVYDEATSTAVFNYGLDGVHRFSERFHFRDAPKRLSPERRLALDRCLQRLHLVAGISYYKTAVPPRISIETSESISRDTARFLNRLYRNGLGEFAYRNKIDLRHISFPYTSKAEAIAPRLKLREMSVVPLGGGKDSIVTLETLKKGGESFTLFSLGDFEAMKDVASVANANRLIVDRQLDSKLFELNRDGALNGHVPISSIIAFVLAASAVLYDFNTAIMSNERSADSPNLSWNGQEINHQYSKGSDFELMAKKQFDEILPGFRYFSLLRPYSELYIAKRFASYRSYHSAFVSCNSAFRLNGRNQRGRWCLACPKCRFVFLSLAPFVQKPDLIRIFGANLLDDEAQDDGFAALFGVRAHKPFECVGEIAESVAALGILADNSAWNNDFIVAKYKESFSRDEYKRHLSVVLKEGSKRNIPKRFHHCLPPANATFDAIWSMLNERVA